MRTDDFSYDLPDELIAQAPAEPRDSCRLLVLDKRTGAVDHERFGQVIDHLDRLLGIAVIVAGAAACTGTPDLGRSGLIGFSHLRSVSNDDAQVQAIACRHDDTDARVEHAVPCADGELVAGRIFHQIDVTATRVIGMCLSVIRTILFFSHMRET